MPHGLISSQYLADWPHVPQVQGVVRQVVVTVHLQHKLQVEVLPVGRVVHQVGIDTLPWLVT